MDKRPVFDLALTRAVTDALEIPVIASGGVGNLRHLVDGVKLGGADAVLAASIFHYGEYTVQQAKAFMAGQGIEVQIMKILNGTFRAQVRRRERRQETGMYVRIHEDFESHFDKSITKRITNDLVGVVCQRS